MLKKIIITGPESTGKSQLANELTKHFEGECVAEFARTYLNTLHRPYNEMDLDVIAQGQIHAISEAENTKKKYLFIDTDLLVIKIWYEHAFKKCPLWLYEAIEKQHGDLYLLPYIDLPWTYDEQREHPHLRAYFFDLYEMELRHRQWPYYIVKGLGQDRLENAVQIINGYFKSNF